MMADVRRRRRRWTRAVGAWFGVVVLAGTACEPGTSAARAPVLASSEALSDSLFAALHARISEDGGYFDTDNLISNEAGYLNVIGALETRGVRGGAYVGVGPDQNYSYVAAIRPELAFMVDIRRDNALHHLLLKALIERAPTRVEFLAGLHGRAPPSDPSAWADRGIEDIVAWVDGAALETDIEALQAEVEAAAAGNGIPLGPDDLATIRRFHRTFIDQGMGLRFTSLGRAPRPYYPTYRQLVLETDADGRQASYLASRAGYETVRDLHLANRIIPVVGDMAGPSALREMGRVMREMGLELTAFYASNVEYYLWRGGTFGAWAENLEAMPAAEDAVIIRSYFPNFGGSHPSALPGYYATQTLQPASTVTEALIARPFASYWDVVTREVLPLEGR